MICGVYGLPTYVTCEIACVCERVQKIVNICLPDFLSCYPTSPQVLPGTNCVIYLTFYCSVCVSNAWCVWLEKVYYQPFVRILLICFVCDLCEPLCLNRTPPFWIVVFENVFFSFSVLF